MSDHKRKRRCVLLPTSNKRDQYAGFLETSSGECFRIGMSCEDGGGQVNPRSLIVDPSLRLRLKPFLSALLGRSQHTQTLDSFLFELLDLTEQATLSSSVLSNSNTGHAFVVPAQFYELLLNELEDLGWSRVLDVRIFICTSLLFIFFLLAFLPFLFPKIFLNFSSSPPFICFWLINVVGYKYIYLK